MASYFFQIFAGKASIHLCGDSSKAHKTAKAGQQIDKAACRKCRNKVQRGRNQYGPYRPMDVQYRPVRAAY
jgi:cytochrome c2